MAQFYQFEIYACKTIYPYENVTKLGNVTVPVLTGSNSPHVVDVAYVDMISALNNISAHTTETEQLGNGIGHKTGTFDDNMYALIDIAPRTQVITDVFENYTNYKLKLVNASGFFAVSYNNIAYYGASLTEFYDDNGNLLLNLLASSGLPFADNTGISNLVVDGFDSNGHIVSESLASVSITVNIPTPDTVQYTVHHEYNINPLIIDWLNNLESGVDTDPFGGGGTTDGTGGTSGGSGGGDFDGTSDPIDFPSLPTLSAADTGFITLFNPSTSQLRSLANYMWSNPLFDLDAWKKIFADPMDAILGLSIVPVNVPSGGSGVVTVGNISTGISMTKASAQFVEVDCGSINVKEYWGAYLDYAPYTKCELHLPYCGTHPIDVDDIMGKSVHIKYHIDILSGGCCAYVKCGNSVLYEFAGQCAASIPITGDDWTNVINGVMQIAASVGSMVATGGLAAPVTQSNLPASIGKAVAIDANIGSTIMSMKPSIEKSGSLGGVGGMLAVQKPYLILTRPKQALPSRQNHYTGYPSFITQRLSSLSGYTQIEHVHLENVPATSAELDEIELLLKGGVLL